MHLKYLLFALLISLMAIVTGCSSSSNQSEQSNLVEEYFLKPTSGEDAAKLDALEKEIVAINNRKEALAKEDHILNLSIKGAEEELAYEEAKGNLLKAKLNLAVGQNDETLVNRAKADIANNELEIERKNCNLELLQMQKESGWDEMDLRDAELAAKLAEWDYYRAKIARVNQDQHFSTLTSVDESERIDVAYFENRMNQLQGEIDGARKTWEDNSADVQKKSETCQNMTSASAAKTNEPKVSGTGADNKADNNSAAQVRQDKQSEKTNTGSGRDAKSGSKDQRSQSKKDNSNSNKKSGSGGNKSPNVRGSQSSVDCF